MCSSMMGSPPKIIFGVSDTEELNGTYGERGEERRVARRILVEKPEGK